MTQEINYADDIGAPDTDQLSNISRLAVKQLTLESEVAEATEKLKSKVAELRVVQEQQLPEALQAANCAEFRLATGGKVSLKEELTMSIPKANMPDVIAWLQSTDNGGVVSREMVVNIGKGQDNLLAVLKAKCEELGFAYEVGENANTATVKAIVRRALESAKLKLDDLKMFGAYQLKKAIIDLKK